MHLNFDQQSNDQNQDSTLINLHFIKLGLRIIALLHDLW